MLEHKILAFDFGIDNGRCVLGTLNNNVLTVEVLHSFKTSELKIANTYKWNIYNLYEQILISLKLYSDRYGGELSAIGIDTWGLDFGFLDDKGQLIGLPNSPRHFNLDMAEGVLEENLGIRRAHELTGIPILRTSALNQLIDMCRRGELSAKYGKRMLFIGDILNYFLTGSSACELSSATCSGLVDSNTKQWSEEIFDIFEIPEVFMTDIVKPGTKIGSLSESISKFCGLSQDIPVISPLSLNLISSSASIPKTNGNVAYLSAGFQGICAIETEKPIINDLTFKFGVGNVQSIFGKNLLIKQTKGLGLISRCQRDWQAEFGFFSYSELMDYAYNSQPFAGVVDVDDPIFENTLHFPKAIVQYLERSGQQEVGYSSIGQISRILFESLALKFKYHLEQIKKTSFKNFDSLHIVGRGSQNNLLCQFCSNLTNTEIIAGPVEASAIGNILVQAYGLKLIGSIDEMRQIVSNSFEFATYKPMHVKEWSEQYSKFLKICNL